MKQYRITRAYEVLRGVDDMKMPVRMARDIYHLVKELEPTFQFAAERQKKLIAEYGGKVAADGMVSFAREEDAKAFRDGVDEMNEVDVEYNSAPIEIDLDALGDNTLFTPAEIRKLDGFVEFK